MILDVLFAAVLVWASYVDIKTRTVQNGAWIAVLLLGFLNFHPASILGGVLVFIPMLLVGLRSRLGGGDIKLAGACGLYLGLNAVPGLLAGLLAACIFVPFYCFIRRQHLRHFSFPLVPYLSFGFILTAILS